MTNGNHTFVSAISTADIVGLLLRQYADLSENYNNLQRDTSLNIIERIKAFKSDVVVEESPPLIAADANAVLDEIRQSIEMMEGKRETIMSPINAVQRVVGQLFRYGGIKIDRRLSFGDAATAIDSEALSAGEKQMLSFICYNAFYSDGVLFVDEPELSLHVDWQRSLFEVLRKQQANNQFIVATHSPFIYAKYPDKELMIGDDRGASEVTP